ncbi:putative zinc finger CCCH domain-containing protein 21 [Panicum virgatum]|uniref:putative zinc finger CCCH domain-containing protein 21 n=1 Tax=Panicum virgatum TaxID=38727 RepID=UPI0019D62C57|nr:putative zinc finger CCCH domain-containing protein 21 [Panicum virgatum]
MEGELGFLSPARPSRVSSERGDDRGFGSPTWSSPLGTLLDSPSSCVSEGRACEDGVSGFSSPTWGSPLEKLFNTPSSGVSNDSRGGNGSGFSSSTWGWPLETLFYSPSSCVSDSRGGGNGSGSGISTPKQAPPLGMLFDSPSSCVPDSRGGGNDSGSAFSTPKHASPLETLLNSPSSCVSDSRGGGNGSGTPKHASPLETLLNSPSSCVSDNRGWGNSSSLRVSKEQDSEVQKAERLLRAITERYNDCFLRLRNATAELADLRRERIRLGAENLHLSLLLEELVVAEQRNQASAVALTPPLKPVQAEAASGCAPKSISIRSKSFISPKQPLREIQPQRLRVRASPAKEDTGGKEKDDGEVEMEAYGQGTLKTELCNKWERGACPYDGRCRLAHGMEELRPVIRHPRYKTLACQLFAAGSGCPYGHRCHFLHSLPSTAESC